MTNDAPSRAEAACVSCGFGARAVPIVAPPPARPQAEAGAPPVRPVTASVLSALTLGVYFLVLVVQWSRWRDGWDTRDRALGFARWGAWMTGASVVVIVLGYAFIFGAMIYGGATGEGPFAPEDEPGGAFFVGFFGIMMLAMLGFAGFLAGRILLFIAQWRVWSSLQERLSWQGNQPRIPPVGLLLIEIFGPQAMQFVAMVLFFAVAIGSVGIAAATGVPPFWLILLYVLYPLLMALPILYVIHETQKRVLDAGAPVATPS